MSNYTYEQAQRFQHIHEDWKRVFVTRYGHISPGWCEKNIHYNYRCFGHYWYFKDPSDAMMFALTWG